MATKYLRNVTTANWSDDTAWSLSSNGPNDTTHPVDGDVVLCDAGSGTTALTINVSSAATSLTCTGFIGTLTGSAALQLKGNLLAVSGMTYSYTGTLTFAHTAGTATITSAGKTICGNLTQDGTGGTLTFADAFVTTGTLTHTAGTITQAAFDISCGAYNTPGTATRVMNYATSSAVFFYITGAGSCWTIASVTGYSNNCGTQLTSGGTSVLATMHFNNASGSARTILFSGSMNTTLPNVLITGSGTITINNGSAYGISCANLSFLGFSGTWTGATNADDRSLAFSVNGSVTLSANMSITTSAGGFVWNDLYNGPLETFTFTSNGKTLPLASGTTYALHIDGTSTSFKTRQFADALTIPCRLNMVSSFNGTLNLNGQTITALTFNLSSAQSRTIAFGTNATLIVTYNDNIYRSLDTTGTVPTITGTAIIELTAVTTNVRDIYGGGALLPTIKISGGTGAGSVTLNNVNCAGLIFANTYACTGFANQTVTIRGPVTLSNHASFALTAGTNAWTFAATSGTHAITSQGKTADFPMTFNGTGGTWQLADALTLSASRTITHTAGTIDLNNQTCSVGIFNTSGSTARVLIFGSGTLICSSTGIVFTCATSTNLTLIPGTGTIKLTDSSATARSISVNNIPLPNIWVSAGTSTTTFTNVGSCINLDFTGMGAGTWAGESSLSISGNVTFVSGMLSTYSGHITFTATSPKTITSANCTLTTDVTFNGVGGSWTLQDAFITFKTLTLTNGILDTNNQNISCFAFYSSNANTRSFILYSNILTLSGNGNVWDITNDTNLSLTIGTSTIKLTGDRGVSTTFNGKSKTYHNIWWAGEGSNNSIVLGSNTFNDFIVDAKTTKPDRYIRFEGGSTQHVQTFTVNGTNKHYINVSSTDGTPHYLVNDSITPITCQYLKLQHSHVSPDALWQAA